MNLFEPWCTIVIAVMAKRMGHLMSISYSEGDS
jgi:hypothetical protein